jgi:hypothetical protein
MTAFGAVGGSRYPNASALSIKLDDESFAMAIPERQSADES